MNNIDMICMAIAELVPMGATLFCFIYGLRHFFKKGKPLYLQTITMAMGCHFLGSIYHICLTFINGTVMDGFSPAYLGRIGFFLFIITASYGQMDRIVDDGTEKMKPSRYIALIAPICVILLYIPNYLVEDVPMSTKIAYALVWIPATISVYFNLKHSIIPDFDFGFIKAIKPYNIFMLCLSFCELLCLSAWNYLYNIPLVITSIMFGILCVCTIVAAKKGAEKWTI